MWRAAGVHTKAGGGAVENNPTEATPEQYVEGAFRKCTSGVHSAFWVHELLNLNISNLKDLFGFSVPKFFFSKLFGNQ